MVAKRNCDNEVRDGSRDKPGRYQVHSRLAADKHPPNDDYHFEFYKLCKYRDNADCNSSANGGD